MTIVRTNGGIFGGGWLDADEELAVLEQNGRIDPDDTLKEPFDGDPNMSAPERRLVNAERRRDMLLIERIFDEIPDTIAFLRQKGHDRMSEGLRKTIDHAADTAIDLMAMVGERVYDRHIANLETAAKLGTDLPRPDRIEFSWIRWDRLYNRNHPRYRAILTVVDHEAQRVATATKRVLRRLGLEK